MGFLFKWSENFLLRRYYYQDFHEERNWKFNSNLRWVFCHLLVSFCYFIDISFCFWRWFCSIREPEFWFLCTLETGAHTFQGASDIIWDWSAEVNTNRKSCWHNWCFKFVWWRHGDALPHIRFSIVLNCLCKWA